MRAVGSVSAALVVLAAAIASPPSAQAAIQIDLTINFIPGNPVFPDATGNLVVPQQLTGVPFFTVPVLGGLTDVTNFFVGGFDSIMLTAGNPTFTGHFIPGNPVIPGNPINVRVCARRPERTKRPADRPADHFDGYLRPIRSTHFSIGRHSCLRCAGRGRQLECHYKFGGRRA